jgi:beta-phosphoglucomutase-like phosphatase (HAD superfamily)
MILASATAGRELRYALSLYGMLPYFDTVLSCADIGAGKDKPDIYLMAAKAAGCAPSELCVVEDSCVALETARSAGFRTVGVFDPYSAGQDRLRAAADIYLEEGRTLTDLIGQLCP